MNLSDEQIAEVFELLHRASSEQRKDFLAHLSFLDFNEKQQLYQLGDVSWANSEPPKERKVSTEKACVEEHCVEDVQLDVYPIYKAYLRKTCYDSEQALRLTFLELQHRSSRCMTWPHR